MAYITINKENFYHNLNQIALKTGSIEKIAIVLKDNAYGHGLEIMAKLASDFGLKEAVVRNIKEANRISFLFENILVLGGKIVQDNKLTFVINTLEQIDDAQEGARVELKVDTGMHRNGISYEQIETALKKIQARGLNLIGVMTHFRSADELGSAFFWQKKNFSEVKKRVTSLGFKDLRFHSHNSAAILRSKIFEEDLVRVGIGAYGYNELPDVFGEVALRPVMSLYAKKISTRVLKKGERVGYGGDFVASKEMTVSTYDLGYGDGWCRGKSKNPYITAEGLPILGRVSMDFVSLETDNEKVCLMHNAQEAAKQLETISYEVVTALSKDIERIVV